MSIKALISSAKLEYTHINDYFHLFLFFFGISISLARSHSFLANLSLVILLLSFHNKPRHIQWQPKKRTTMTTQCYSSQIESRARRENINRAKKNPHIIVLSFFERFLFKSLFIQYHFFFDVFPLLYVCVFVVNLIRCVSHLWHRYTCK